MSTDPFAELRAAHAAGKMIQVRYGAGDPWRTLDDPRFDSPVHMYRVKPEPKVKVKDVAKRRGKAWAFIPKKGTVNIYDTREHLRMMLGLMDGLNGGRIARIKWEEI